MAESVTLARAITGIVGDSFAITDPAACAAYTVQGRVPSCVVAPGNLDELSAVMRVANEQRAAVTAWGGGTQQYIGNPPKQLDLVIRTERLQRVLIYEPDDLTISVEAGITIAALRELTAQHGQMLPIDPPCPTQASLGGLIATATDGPRRLGYGTLRELLIGITVVEASGRISRGGGMVVKNVSGFDMMKLYLGSLGTLAVIASANFKLQPIPRAAATLLCQFATLRAAFSALDALHQTQLTPTAAEYLNGTALAQVLAPDIVSSAEPHGALVFRTEGLPAAVERHINDLQALASQHSATDIQRLDSAAESALWARIADLPQQSVLTSDEALLKFTVLPSDTETTIQQLTMLASRAGASLTINARALNGVLYARLRPISVQALQILIAALPDTQWVATALPDVPRWGTPPAGTELMRRIKAEFDPQGTLNNGRFIEGM